MTNKRKTAPSDIASESAAGEEDPGAALEMTMSDKLKKPSPGARESGAARKRG